MAFKASPARKRLLILTAVVAVLVLAAAAVLLRGVDFRGIFDRAMTAVRGAGPWTFFLAMALLPAVGFPMITFALTAGPLFSERLGPGGVVAAALTAASINIFLSYCLARWALRPWLTRLLERLGYRLPRFDSTDLTDMIVLLRVTPGPPFFVQNYLLGLAGAPLIRYLVISCGVTWSYMSAFILFGDAMRNGKGRIALVAASILVTAIAATHLVRHHYARKKPKAA